MQYPVNWGVKRITISEIKCALVILLLSIIGAISVKLLQRIDRSFFVHLHVNGGASQKHCLLLEAMVGPLLVKGCSRAKGGIGVFLLYTTRQVEI